MLIRARVLCGLFVIVACGDDPEPAVDSGVDAQVDLGARDLGAGGDGSAVCTREEDCLNRVFCDGRERCMPSAPGADARGCVAGAPACPSGMVCDEGRTRCGSRCDLAPDADGDGIEAIACGGADCDDADPMRFPRATETCAGARRELDEDCDPCTVAGATDGDLDGDGYVSETCTNVFSGAPPACGAGVELAGATTVRGVDCDDSLTTGASKHPTAAELCDTLDNDCDGMNDEGVVRMPTEAARCNAVDDDCDGMVDEGVQGVAYRDRDGDGWGDPAMSSMAVTCAAVPSGYVFFTGDCVDDPLRDRAAQIHPDAVELCNTRDENCSNAVDPGGSDPTEDGDRDGHAPNGNACVGGPLPKDDCNDSNTAIFGATDRCDVDMDGPIDTDCDGMVDEPLEEDADCVTRFHTMAGCTAGVCSNDQCVAPYVSCSSAIPGCESNPATDPMNCGGCGRPCIAGARCAASTCYPRTTHLVVDRSDGQTDSQPVDRRMPPLAVSPTGVVWSAYVTDPSGNDEAGHIFGMNADGTKAAQTAQFTAQNDPVMTTRTFLLVNDLEVDADGNLYLSGEFDARATFGSTVLTAPSLSGFIASYSPTLALRWAVATPRSKSGIVVQGGNVMQVLNASASIHAYAAATGARTWTLANTVALETEGAADANATEACFAWIVGGDTDIDRTSNTTVISPLRAGATAFVLFCLDGATGALRRHRTLSTTDVNGFLGRPPFLSLEADGSLVVSMIPPGDETLSIGGELIANVPRGSFDDIVFELSPTFGVRWHFYFLLVSAMDVHTDGKVVVAGQALDHRWGITQYDATGAVAWSIATPQTQVEYAINVAWQPSGHVVRAQDIRNVAMTLGEGAVTTVDPSTGDDAFIVRYDVGPSS